MWVSNKVEIQAMTDKAIQNQGFQNDTWDMWDMRQMHKQWKNSHMMIG